MDKQMHEAGIVPQNIAKIYEEYVNGLVANARIKILLDGSAQGQ